MVLLLMVCSSPFSFCGETSTTGSKIDLLKRDFRNPPDDCRIMMRWWWFGAAVTKPELQREIEAMKDAGIGGFEVQPVYPMTLDDPKRGIVNLPFLSPGFLDDLHYAGATAKQMGMRFDLTLGSGWPYGGSTVPVTQASGALRVVTITPNAGAISLPMPSLEIGENLIAAFSFRQDPSTKGWKDIQRLALDETMDGARLVLPNSVESPEKIALFISSRTGMMVKRPAVGAEGFVVDHLDHDAVAHYLETVGDPLLNSLSGDPPYAIFSDSLEDYGADWTPSMLEEFHKRRGYDLVPHLPALVADVGPETTDIRYDWGKTLTELLEDNYLQQIRAWAQTHDTRFRAQVYGPPAAILSSNEFVDLPEGEGANWRGFSPIRWAASINHFEGQAVTSSESFTWTHTLPFRATPLDLKAEADVDFLEGSNQIIGHGWPYSPAYAEYPGWTFYAAGALDDQNPWWIVMPEVAKYMQRVSFVLRQGRPVSDVALFLPTADAWAQATPGPNVPNDFVESISDTIGFLLGKQVTKQILDAGLSLDYVDSRMIDQSGIKQPILILPGVTRIPLDTYEKVEAFAESGGTVIATRILPSRSPGFRDEGSDSDQVREISKRLFQSPGAKGYFLPDESALADFLRKTRTPDLRLSSPSEAIGFVHRRLENGDDLYFVANTSNQNVTRTATFRTGAKNVERWNPYTGTESQLGHGATVNLDLAPYDSEILCFRADVVGSGDAADAHPKTQGTMPLPMDLSKEWNVLFPALQYSTVMHTLHSWTDDEATRFFSGSAIYTKDFDVQPKYLQQGIEVDLNFGPGTPSPDYKPQEDGMHARLESPIREAALVYMNGKLAGAVWCPPYRVDVTRLLNVGHNHVRIVVGNLALNELAGRSAPDYRLLNQRYGERFTPQAGMSNVKPLPAGILGDVSLVPLDRAGLNK